MPRRDGLARPTPGSSTAPAAYTVGGQLAGQRLHLGHHRGGEPARPAACGADHADRPCRAGRTGAATCARCHQQTPRPRGDRGVGRAVGGGQHDPGPQHVAMLHRWLGAPGPAAPAAAPSQRTIMIGTRHRHASFVTRPVSQSGRRHAGQRDSSIMDAVPTPPESTKTSLRQRLHRPAPATAGRSWPSLTIRHRGAVRLRRRPTARRHHPAAVPAALRRLRQQLGLRDLPGQPRRLRRLPSCPAATPSAPPKKPSTAPAASTSTTPPPGSNPRRTNGRDH